jgi:hypothetical protein
MVSAWVSENNLVLGQMATEKKSNEITAIPAPRQYRVQRDSNSAMI